MTRVRKKVKMMLGYRKVILMITKKMILKKITQNLSNTMTPNLLTTVKAIDITEMKRNKKVERTQRV